MLFNRQNDIEVNSNMSRSRQNHQNCLEQEIHSEENRNAHQTQKTTHEESVELEVKQKEFKAIDLEKKLSKH